MAPAEIKRTRSGIDGLDDLIEGGFPSGTSTLVTGRPGAGKTIMGAEFIYRGATKYDENGLIVLVGQSPKRFKLDVAKFGWDFDKLEKNGKVSIITQPILETDFNPQLADIISLSEKMKVKRVMIDSFSILFSMFSKDINTRREMMTTIDALCAENCTLFLTLEKIAEGVHYPEEFATDSVIDLDLVDFKHKTLRKMKVTKMRRTKTSGEITLYDITNKGIKVFPKPRLEQIKETPTGRVKTGIKGLDDMSGGGFLRGSSSILTGSAGTGKTNLGLQFLVKGAKEKEPGVFVSFEEATPQLYRTANSFGWDLQKLEKDGLVKLVCDYPENKYAEGHFLGISKAVESIKAKRLVLDSISSIKNVFDETTFKDFLKGLLCYLKKKQVTVIFTENASALLGAASATESGTSTMVDNILMMRYVEIESAIKRSIILIKNRGSEHDKEIREFIIGKKGIEIKTAFEGIEGVMSGTAKKIGKSTTEKLEEEFARTLGPMGLKKFAEQTEAGVSEENLMEFVNSLVQDKIIKKREGEEFKDRIKLILQ